MQIPTIRDVLRARLNLYGRVDHTPLRLSRALSQSTGAQVWLKLDHWQPTGSFKVRGAVHLLSTLTAEERKHGLVTASAGNHALAVGYAAEQLGLAEVTVFVPRTAPRAKVDKLRLYPVRVVQEGESYDQAHRAAEHFQVETGATFLHAYEDPRTVAGQGTVALEILEDRPELDAILVPVGGGGLISGVAIAVKALAPAVRVIGVQPDASPALRDSLRDGRAYEDYPAAPTIADGLAGGIGRLCFEVAQQSVDEVIVVREQSIHAAVADLVAHEQLLVEGSGAVGVAALRESPARWAGQRLAVILTGANIDPATLVQCAEGR